MASRIYIAAPWDHKDQMPEVATKLEAMGWEVTHKWWLVEGEGSSNKDREKCAQMDVDGVKTANVVLLFNTKKSEGKAVEQGIAIAKNIPIIAVGVRGAHSKNVFHFLPCYYWTEKLDTAYDILDFVKEITRG